MVVFRDGDSAAPVRNVLPGMVVAEDNLTFVPADEPQPMPANYVPVDFTLAQQHDDRDWAMWLEDTFCDPAERGW